MGCFPTFPCSSQLELQFFLVSSPGYVPYHFFLQQCKQNQTKTELIAIKKTWQFSTRDREGNNWAQAVINGYFQALLGMPGLE